MAAISKNQGPSNDWQYVTYQKQKNKKLLPEKEEYKELPVVPFIPPDDQLLTPGNFYQSKKIRSIVGVHRDDIHSIIRLANQTLVSGSKDGALKQWSLDGKAIRTIYDPEQINYQSWITALSPVGEDLWVSGTRDGYVHLWNLDGDLIDEIRAKPKIASLSHCKQRNTHRVLCLEDLSNHFNPAQFAVGWPGQFTIHQVGEEAYLSNCKTHKCDWVYSIRPVSKSSVLAVTACRLDLWTTDDALAAWHRKELVSGGVSKDGQKRFISKITALQTDPAHFGLSVFDGTVSAFDLQKEKIIFRGKEHNRRVWTIENIDSGCFASCADDGFVKIWDLRQSKSVCTFRDNEEELARISVLIKTQDFELLSGSCPDTNGFNRAQFSFWDLRK